MLSVTISSVIVALFSFVLMITLIKFSGVVVNKKATDLDGNDDSLGDTHEAEIEAVPVNFTFSQCGDHPNSLPIQIKKFSMKPDPLVLPGIIKIKLSFRVKETIDGPIKASIELKKHTGPNGWYTLPCNEAGYGSCDYPDVCPSFKSFDPICPKEVKERGHNCRCPLQPGKYSFKTIKLPINAGLGEGPFRIVAKFSSENGTPLSCLDSTIIMGNAIPPSTLDPPPQEDSP